MTSSIDVTQFIADVYQRPAIWNRSYHCNKMFMEETWNELAKLHKQRVQILKAKWKGLRDNFRVEYKRLPRDAAGELLINPEDHDTKWLHFKALVFLMDHMRSRSNKNDDPLDSSAYNYSNNSIDDTQDYDDYSNHESFNPACLIQIPDDVEDLTFNDDDDLQHTPTLNIGGQTVNLGKLEVPGVNGEGTSNGIKNPNKRKREDSFEQQDDDYHFLMSMHPYMTQLGASQKLKIRMKIQKLVFRELYKDDEIDA